MEVEYEDGMAIPRNPEGIIECVRFALQKLSVRYNTGDVHCTAVGDEQCIAFMIAVGLPDFDARECATEMRAALHAYLEKRYGPATAGTFETPDQTPLREHLRRRLAPKPPSEN